MQKFYVEDCPKNRTVAMWIKEQLLEWTPAAKQLYYESDYAKYMNVVFKFKGDVKGLQESFDTGIATYGKFGWKSAEGEDPTYSGISVTHNPNLQYDDHNIHNSNLGTSKNHQADFYMGSSVNQEFVKDSYLDGMSFNELTPAASYGYLGELLRSIQKNVTITRSRIGIVSGKTAHYPMFHCDVDTFELTRLNIPIRSNDCFAFQFEGAEPYVLEEGKAYTWQTRMPHRVLCYEPTNIDRSNLVIGWSPWLSYNYEERYWYTNQYYLKKHPFDMLVDGDVTDQIELIGMF